MSDYLRWEMKQYWMLWVELTTNLPSYRRPKIARETMFLHFLSPAPNICQSTSNEKQLYLLTTNFPVIVMDCDLSVLNVIKPIFLQRWASDALFVVRMARPVNTTARLIKMERERERDVDIVPAWMGAWPARVRGHSRHCTCLDWGMACSGKGV